MARIKQIQVRRDTAANWTSTNPVLASGETGLETDTRKLKYGDGTTAWTSLAYITTAPSGTAGGDLNGTYPNPSVNAATFTSAGKVKQTVYNVMDYGAVGNGVTDDITAINNTVNAAAFTGGIVQLSSQHYISTPIIPANNVWIRGNGIDSTTIFPSTTNTGGSGDGIRLTISSLPYAFGVHISDLTIDCSAQYPTGQFRSTPATYSNGLTLQGIDDLLLENVKVIKPFGYGVVVSSLGGNAPFIKRPIVRNLHVLGERGGFDSLGGGGIINGFVDGLYIHPAADGTNTYGSANNWTDMIGTTIRNVRAWTTFIYSINRNTTPLVAGSSIPVYNPFSFTVTVTVTGTISACNVNGTSQGTGGTYSLPGFGQIILTYTSSPTWVWTPPTAPSIPASTVNATNPFDFPAPVTITGGTVSAVVINGTTQGTTSGYFLVPLAGTISITYTVAPTWSWNQNSTAPAIQTDFGAINVLWEDMNINGFYNGVIISNINTRTSTNNIKVSKSNFTNIAFKGITTNVSTGYGISGIDIVDCYIDRFAMLGGGAGVAFNGSINFSILNNNFGATGNTSYCIQLNTDGVNNNDFGVVANNSLAFNSSAYAILTTGAGTNVKYIGNSGYSDSSSTGNITLDGSATRTIGVSNGGNILLLQGSSVSELSANYFQGGTLNSNGGALFLRAGESTGSGTSQITFQVSPATTNTLTALANVFINSTDNPGSGYVANDILTIPGGTGGTITVTSVAVSGQISQASPSFGGSGYIVGDSLTIPGGTGGTAVVSSIGETGKVISLNNLVGGSGYTAGDIAATGGTGTGLVLTLSIYATGAIRTTTITTAGSGYVFATAVSAAGGTGTGATFDVIPYGNTFNNPSTMMALGPSLLNMSEGTNIAFGTSTGTKIGTTTSQKLGFFNATPIVKPSGDILTALSNLGLVSSPTLTADAITAFATLVKFK